jgi:hypothetical protein
MDRTLRFGLALPSVRLQVHKDCIDLANALSVIVGCFNQHSSEQLRGRTGHSQHVATATLRGARRPASLLDDRLDRVRRDAPAPARRGAHPPPHREVGGVAAARGGGAFHLWLTSPALEVLDITFALNLGWATPPRTEHGGFICQPLHAPRDNPIYHPTLGDGFFLQSGAAVSINLAPPR